MSMSVLHGLSLLLCMLVYVDAVEIIFEYGEQLFFRANISIDTVISDLKVAIADKVRIHPDEQHINDFYKNAEQEKDGFGEFLDNKKLSGYGITEKSIGKVLCVLRKVTINRSIPNSKDQLSVVYLDQSVIRIKLNGSQTVGDLKSYLSLKLEVPLETAIPQDWYYNSLIEADGKLIPTKTLAEYGFATGTPGKVMSISTLLFKTKLLDQHGPLVLSYGLAFATPDLPFNQSSKVGCLKDEISQITGIPPADQILLDFKPNAVQEADHNVWQNDKTLADYGMQDGKRAVLIVLRKDPKVPQ